MIGLRSSSRRAAPSATRTTHLLAVLAAATLTMTACSPGAEDPQPAQDAAAASSLPAASPESGSPESGSAPEGGDDADQDESGTEASAEPEPQELFTQREISQIPLTQSELPFTPDSHSTLTGLDFFQNQLGVAAEVYTESFGEGECASAMDRINADLIGERPELGVVQEYQHEHDDRTESLYVWMLGLEESPDSGAIWDRVVEACTAQPLRGETDSVDFEAYEAHDFRGLELDMEVHDGESVVEVLGFSASMDYGRHLLMVSAANMDAETFDTIVELQAKKLATFDHQRGE